MARLEENLRLRAAVREDAVGIAQVHVQAWRETYQGLLHPQILDELSVARRQRMWTRNLEHPQAQVVILVLESGRSGDIVGFANAGPERGMLPAYDGELYAIYLLQKYQGAGRGRQLFQAAARHLAGIGFRRMMLWVLDSNPTRGFYEHLGGRLVGEQQVEFGEQPYREVAYGWSDLAALAGDGQPPE